MNLVEFMKQMQPKTRDEMLDYLSEGCENETEVRNVLDLSGFSDYELSVQYAIALKNNVPKPLFTFNG